MIQGMIIKKVLDIVMKQLLKQFKLDKIQEYVEKPNDADKRIDSLEKKLKKLEKIINGGKKKMKKIKERF
tara:strand:- start:13 stop:222 length:210 start_codon:yes stop_codon:yes gene_type:complete